jgi:3-oxoacyl-[acyl-carrier protein] reductase
MVRHLLEQGDTVCTFSRSRTPAMDELEAGANGERFFFDCVDIADSDAVRAYVKQVVKRYGKVDCLVNNAGIARDGLLAMQSDAEIDLLLGVNLKGTLSLSRACIRPMLRAKKGRIVQISSIIGQRGYRGLATYAATKAAMDGITRSLARELGERNITVNSIAPGYLDTEMSHGLDDNQRGQIIRRTPLGRLGTPADILGLLDYLLSPAADFVTGQTVVVDGGITV